MGENIAYQLPSHPRADLLCEASVTVTTPCVKNPVLNKSSEGSENSRDIRGNAFPSPPKAESYCEAPETVIIGCYQLPSPP